MKLYDELKERGLIDNITSPDLIEKLNINIDGKSIYEILNCTKPVFRIAKNLNVSLNVFQNIKSLWEEENSLTEDTYQKLKECCDYIDNILALKRNYNLSYQNN